MTTMANEKTEEKTSERKPYKAPELRHLGSVRELTLGPTAGKGEIVGFLKMS